jgi:hypothetical protein
VEQPQRKDERVVRFIDIGSPSAVADPSAVSLPNCLEGQIAPLPVMLWQGPGPLSGPGPCRSAGSAPPQMLTTGTGATSAGSDQPHSSAQGQVTFRVTCRASGLVWWPNGVLCRCGDRLASSAPLCQWFGGIAVRSADRKLAQAKPIDAQWFCHERSVRTETVRVNGEGAISCRRPLKSCDEGAHRR